MSGSLTVGASAVTRNNGSTDVADVQFTSSRVQLSSEDQVTVQVDSTTSAKSLRVLKGASSYTPPSDANYLGVHLVNTGVSENTDLTLYGGASGLISVAEFYSGSTRRAYIERDGSSGDTSISSSGTLDITTTQGLTIGGAGSGVAIDADTDVTLDPSSGPTYTWPVDEPAQAAILTTTSTGTLSWRRSYGIHGHARLNAGNGSVIFLNLGYLNEGGVYPEWFQMPTSRTYSKFTLMGDNEFTWSSGTLSIDMYKYTTGDDDPTKETFSVTNLSSGVGSAVREANGGYRPDNTTAERTWIASIPMDFEVEANQFLGARLRLPSSSGSNAEVSVFLVYFDGTSNSFP